MKRITNLTKRYLRSRWSLICLAAVSLTTWQGWFAPLANERGEAYTSGFGVAHHDNIWSGGVDQGLSVMDVSPMLAMIMLAEIDFLSAIGISGKPAHNIIYRWVNDELNPISFTATFTYVDDAADDLVVTSPTTDAELQRVLRVGSLIQPENEDYVYQIDTGASIAASPSTIPITAYGNKGVGGSGMDTSRTWYVIGNPFIEGADASSDIARPRDYSWNCTQILERAVQITETRQHMEMYGVSNESKHQIRQRMFELKRELNMAAIRSVAFYTAGAYTGDTDRRSMKGLRQQIADYGNTGTYKDAGTAADLTPALIDNLADAMHDLGGVDAKSNLFLLVSPYQQTVISGFDEDFVRLSQSDRKRGKYVSHLLLKRKGIEIPIVMDRWMPKDSVALVDKSRITMRHLRGDQLSLKQLAKTGRAEKWEISGQYSLEVRSPGRAHGWLYDLATS